MNQLVDCNAGLGLLWDGPTSHGGEHTGTFGCFQRGLVSPAGSAPVAECTGASGSRPAVAWVDGRGSTACPSWGRQNPRECPTALRHRPPLDQPGPKRCHPICDGAGLRGRACYVVPNAGECCCWQSPPAKCASISGESELEFDPPANCESIYGDSPDPMKLRRCAGVTESCRSAGKPKSRARVLLQELPLLQRLSDFPGGPSALLMPGAAQ